MARLVAARSLPRLVLPEPAAMNAAGDTHGYIGSEIASPAEDMLHCGSLPTLDSVLANELAKRMGSDPAAEDDDEAEHDKQLRLAAHVGQILLERHDKQEQKIEQLQRFIEEILEQNRELNGDLGAARENSRVLEAERDFLDASLQEVEVQQRDMAAARVTADVRQANLQQRVKEMSTRCEEQEAELETLQLKLKTAQGRHSSAEGSTDNTPRTSPGGGQLEERAKDSTGEDPWRLVADLRSRLEEQSRASATRENNLREELARSEAERQAVSDKLKGTQNAVRNAFQRRRFSTEDSSSSEVLVAVDDTVAGHDDGDGDETDGSELAVSALSSLQVDDSSSAMQSLPVTAYSSTLHRSRSQCQAGGQRPRIAQRLFQDEDRQQKATARTSSSGTSPSANPGLSLWSEVSQQNAGLQHRYENLLRSFHCNPGDYATTPSALPKSSYSGLFEDLFGMLHKLKSRLVTDLTATSESPLELSSEILMPM
ncbi:uncharacterized protein LOC135811452 [Sycon ciliatum]|uniref:uncharacterized protein LOC135811452 n=1 Tax=Sycon ciliatum TaxID=27933 RepID=UPI0031F629B0